MVKGPDVRGRGNCEGESEVWSDEREEERFRKNETGMGTKKGKPIKTLLRCLSHGPVGPIR